MVALLRGLIFKSAEHANIFWWSEQSYISFYIHYQTSLGVKLQKQVKWT